MMVLQFVCCVSLFVLNIISPVVSLRSNESFAIGEDYLEWVNAMGSFKRDAFFQQESNDKLFIPCKTIRVSKNPKQGHFASVQEAINSIPVVNLCRVVISIAKGTYREKIEIPATMAYVTLVGDSGHKTIIEWSSTADMKGKDGRPLGTYNSATFAINAPYFIAKKITFKNTAPLAPPGALGKQAVALRISGDAASFIGCRFIGSQDTLYDQSGRHYFKNCYIEGSVDFIFGNGLSLYEGCHLHAQTISYGALTAQKRESLLEETGFSFLNCKVTGSGAFYLGRAWGSFSRVVFAYTYMDKIITPRGWYDWGDKNRQMTVFYGQYKCYGPGANYGGRVAWSRELTQEEAKPFISLDFISGYDWISNGLIRKFKKWV